MQKVREEVEGGKKLEKKNPFQKCEPLSLTPNENEDQEKKRNM
jgi:hypothetical protein